jgi:small subunit ribosomal protein S6
MTIYETVFMARQELSAAQVEKLTDATFKVAEKLGAKLIKKEDWGLRTLAYPVKKAKKAYYILMEYEAPADAMIEMERTMRFDEQVLRFLTIKRDEKSTEQSPILNKDRDDLRFDDNMMEAA